MNTPEFQEYLEKFTREFNLAHDSLTGQQLAEAIRQALLCGDFILNVVKRDVPVVTDLNLYTVEITQQIIYRPYSEAEALRGRVEYLEGRLREFGITVDPPFSDEDNL